MEALQKQISFVPWLPWFANGFLLNHFCLGGRKEQH